MNQEYEESLARLNRLKQTPNQNANAALANNQSVDHISSRTMWISLLLTVASELAIWWIYPLIYSKNLAGGQWQQNPLLVTYTIILAIAIYFCMGQGFFRWLNLLIALVPLGFLYFLYGQMSIQQIILLGLLPLTLILINITWLNLQNMLGLILFAGVATLSIPVVIFYQQNTFLTLPFLTSLLPLFLSYLYYMSSIFIPKGQKKRVISLFFGIVFLLDVLTLPWNSWTLLAIVLIVFTWMILINLSLKAKYRLSFLSFLQMITILAIFLQQK
ncbi:hypothetical protein [Weissella halotolerans]|uniref:Membrane protein n=1 Tax=Weissella halotolerans DSM 20190 TaxID=1123500 RepID=A0A0R2FSI3_9LACO|nr:hypothetical protein [Weissella halotolerans]KRN31304.1 membrane protein [Weissella halotolerans DSM 20190]